MKLVVNGKVFLEDRFYDKKAVLIDNNKIKDILDLNIENIEQDKFEIIDAKGGYIIPGFIDLQINGCGGVLLNDDISEETIRTMHKTNLKSGCTSFTPTLITTSDENMEKALELMKNIDKENLGVLGLHIEGPYISVEKKGIHNQKFIRKADDKMISKIIESGKENVRIITLAPEHNNGEIIFKLKNAGINVAVGHSNATFEEVQEKEKYGLTLATHLYNGMSSFGHRTPGVVGAIFDSSLCAGIIVDGFHCHYSAIKSAKKIMGDRLYLVTDAVSPVGTQMEFFYFEGRKVFYKDGKCFGEDGTLGGSALTMDQGVRNLVNHCGLTLEEAIRMATVLPARAIKIENEFGKLYPGYYADIVILNKELFVEKVIFKGNLIK